LEYQREPVFDVPGDTRLLIEAGTGTGAYAGDEAVGDFLAHAIARNPANLRAHTQRIYLHRRRGDRVELIGALIDLFIGLGSRGQALRVRLLRECRSLLDESAYRHLAVAIRTGVAATDPLPPAQTSLLSKGVDGCAVVVRGSGAAGTAVASGERDFLAEAESHIEYGQLDEAKETLEQGIAIHPDDERLHKDLLEVYRYTDDHEAFTAMRANLQAQGNPYLGLWREQQVFDDWESADD
jgi:hypothetical protein